MPTLFFTDERAEEGQLDSRTISHHSANTLCHAFTALNYFYSITSCPNFHLVHSFTSFTIVLQLSLRATAGGNTSIRALDVGGRSGTSLRRSPHVNTKSKVKRSFQTKSKGQVSYLPSGPVCGRLLVSSWTFIQSPYYSYIHIYYSSFFFTRVKQSP